MFKIRYAGILAGAALLWSASASAQQAWIAGQASVRAGPDATYPVVAVLQPGIPVNVVGCVAGYGWCDVIFGADRGWVPGRRLNYVYEHRRVPVYSYGAAIGLPIVTFSLLNYWDSYYRARPWYNDRPRYYTAPHANWSHEHYAPNYNAPHYNAPYNAPNHQSGNHQYGPRPGAPYVQQQAAPQYRGQPQQYENRGGRQQYQPAPQAQQAPVQQPHSRPANSVYGPNAVVDAQGRVSVPMDNSGGR